MYQVTCIECGKKYESAVKRDGYCEECRSKKIAETKHKYYESRKLKRAETKKTLKNCERCDRLFDPVKSDQTLCARCQLLKEQNYKMTASNQYRKDFNDVIQIKVPKGRRAVLKETAGKYGMNLTSFILRSIDFFDNVYSLPLEDIENIEAIVYKRDKK